MYDDVICRYGTHMHICKYDTHMHIDMIRTCAYADIIRTHVDMHSISIWAVDDDALKEGGGGGER